MLADRPATVAGRWYRLEAAALKVLVRERSSKSGPAARLTPRFWPLVGSHGMVRPYQ